MAKAGLPVAIQMDLPTRTQQGEAQFCSAPKRNACSIPLHSHDHNRSHQYLAAGWVVGGREAAGLEDGAWAGEAVAAASEGVGLEDGAWAGEGREALGMAVVEGCG